MPEWIIRKSYQFTSTAFIGLLMANEIAISMDRRGAWRDNVAVEHAYA